MDVIIRPLIPDDEAFLREALYYAIHVPPGEAAPAPEIVDLPALPRAALARKAHFELSVQTRSPDHEIISTSALPDGGFGDYRYNHCRSTALELLPI